MKTLCRFYNVQIFCYCSHKFKDCVRISCNSAKFHHWMKLDTVCSLSGDSTKNISLSRRYKNGGWKEGRKLWRRKTTNETRTKSSKSAKGGARGVDLLKYWKHDEVLRVRARGQRRRRRLVKIKKQVKAGAGNEGCKCCKKRIEVGIPCTQEGGYIKEEN